MSENGHIDIKPRDKWNNSSFVVVAFQSVVWLFGLSCNFVQPWRNIWRNYTLSRIYPRTYDIRCGAFLHYFAAGWLMPETSENMFSYRNFFLFYKNLIKHFYYVPLHILPIRTLHILLILFHICISYISIFLNIISLNFYIFKWQILMLCISQLKH